MTAYPKFEYVRSKALLRAVASLPCQHCGLDGQTQPAHANEARYGKCRGIKASDVFVAALCAKHHYELDQGNKLSRDERQAMWANAWRRTVKLLVRNGDWPMDVPIPDIWVLG